MKILCVGVFDAAAYCWHLSVAFNRAFEGKHVMETCFQEKTMVATKAHHLIPVPGPECLQRIEEADLVILNGGCWDYSTKANTAWLASPVGQDILQVPAVSERCPPEKTIILLPGSTSLRGSIAHYQELYQGYRIICSNTDLVDDYGATWIPACVEDTWDSGEIQYAFCRQTVVSHFGTDTRIKNTDNLYDAAKRAKWGVVLAQALAHAEVPKLRAQSSVCFDQMQGYTCVVSMESLALGQANIVHMAPRDRELWVELAGSVPPFLDVDNVEDLANMLVRMSGDMDELKARGMASREWYVQHMSNERKARYFAEVVL